MKSRRAFLIAPMMTILAAILFLGTGGAMPHANAQLPGTLNLDMNPANGAGPCNPIDDFSDAGIGDTFEVAICLTGSSVPTYSFNIDVAYDDTVDECVPVDCPGSVGCTDTNPDANAGSTSWTTPDLGTDCDCSLGGELPPQCDRNPDEQGADKGQASIYCYCATPTLPVGEGVSSPVAVITFKRIAEGQDIFSFGVAALYEEQGDNILRCPGERCLGGVTDMSGAPTPTPGAGETPGAAETPGGEIPTVEPAAATASAATAVAQGTPLAVINEAATATAVASSTKAASAATNAAKTPGAKPTPKPGTAAQESNDSSGPNAALIAGVIVAAIIIGGGGWYAYRRYRVRR